MCDGGEQTLQRMCVNPRGGEPCVGESTLVRQCNTKPCPTTFQVQGPTSTLNPIVKTAKISERF